MHPRSLGAVINWPKHPVVDVCAAAQDSLAGRVHYRRAHAFECDIVQHKTRGAGVGLRGWGADNNGLLDTTEGRVHDRDRTNLAVSAVRIKHKSDCGIGDCDALPEPTPVPNDLDCCGAIIEFQPLNGKLLISTICIDDC